MNGTEAAAKAVHGIVDGLRGAWNRHDAAAFAQYFLHDAEFTNVFGTTARGRTEIERNHAFIFSTFLKDSRWTESQAEIRWIRPDIACVNIRWELIGSRDVQDNEWSPRQGLISLVASEAGGEWSIEVFHNMDLPSEQKPC